MITMHMSQKGLDLVKSFEGYLDRMPDGSCRAYYCPAGKLTIGWGCTEGVTEGLVWTRQQAEEGLRRELLKHEAAVKKLVTVDLNQNEFDALTSFTYNAGSGALETSSLLKRLNRGDREGAARGFGLWVKITNPKTKKKETSAGLVNRRRQEAALFLMPAEPPQVPTMPQMVVSAPSSVVEAAGRSRTLSGGLAACGSLAVLALDKVGQAAEFVAQSGLDAVAQMTKYEPIAKLAPSAKYMGAAVGTLAIVTVLYARIDAARKGKNG